MSLTQETLLKQRSDYTHRHNSRTGRFGWLRLTPAYSLKIVEELIAQSDRPMCILDPFCGTATTALCSTYSGHSAITTDINPFLVWFGKAKTDAYLISDLDAARQAALASLALKTDEDIKQRLPPLHNIERWWPMRTLSFLLNLRTGILCSSEDGSKHQNLLLIAFCRTLISLSNASFNHQSMSFKNDAQLSLQVADDLAAVFLEDVNFVLRGAAENPTGKASVILGDSRDVCSQMQRTVDRVITSPPYVNRMSYIRELRPYMYWLNWLSSGREAGELDWKAIGGTWGIATSRLAEWAGTERTFQSSDLEDAVEQIAHADNKNGALLGTYVYKYFEDMWLHFQTLTPVLSCGAELHYIVGNSSFYGVLLPAEQFFAKMLRSLGFSQVKCTPIRKRNSKKELVEFDVSAVWTG